MRVLRAVAWMFAGGFALGFAGVALGWIDPARLPLVGHLFEQRARDVEPEPQPQPERSHEPERADFDPPPMAEPSPAGPAPLPHCCVDRQHLGPVTLFEIQDALTRRWPELNRMGSDQIAAGDRVAFLIEVGTEPQTFDREVLTGVVVDADASTLDVELDAPDGCSHGLCRGDRRKVPRRAVLGWSRAGDPQRRAAVEWKPTPNDDGVFVRHVEVGEPIALALPDQRPGMRWSVEPAGSSFRLLDVQPDNLAHVVFDRASRAGRFTVRLHADDPGWESALLGHWAFQVKG